MRRLMIAILILFTAACANGPPNLVNFDYQIRQLSTAQGAQSLGQALIDGRLADEMIDRSLPVCRVAMASPDVAELDVNGTPGDGGNSSLRIFETNVRNKSILNPCSDFRVRQFSIALNQLGVFGQITRGTDASAAIEISETGAPSRMEEYSAGTIVGAVDDYNATTTWTEGRFEAILGLDGNSQQVMIISNGAFAMTD